MAASWTCKWPFRAFRTARYRALLVQEVVGYWAQNPRVSTAIRQKLTFYLFPRITKYLTVGPTETTMKVGFRASRVEASQPCRRRTFRNCPTRLCIRKSSKASHTVRCDPPLEQTFHADRAIGQSLRAARPAPDAVHGQCTAYVGDDASRPERSARRGKRTRR